MNGLLVDYKFDVPQKIDFDSNLTALQPEGKIQIDFWSNLVIQEIEFQIIILKKSPEQKYEI